MRLIGLTGGIAAGKSTATGMLRRLGVPVFDTDAEVAALGARGDVVSEIGRLLPGAVKDGRLDKDALRRLAAEDPLRLRGLERIYHRHLRRGLAKFQQRLRLSGKPRSLAAVDAPLLFEAGWDRLVSFVLAVQTPDFLRRRRVLSGRGWDEARFQALERRQLPAAEKCRRADWRLPGGLSRAHLQRALRRALLRIGDMP